MTETEFRLKYSELIEYYQYIEERLKYICAFLLTDEEKGWLDRLNDIDSDPFGMLVTNIQSLQTQKQVAVLSQKDIDALNEMRITRNYWVHQCFGGLWNSIIFKKDELKDPEHGKRIIKDLSKAIEWDRKLTEKCGSIETKQLIDNKY